MTPYEAVVAVENASDDGILAIASLRELRLLLHPDRFGRDAEWAKRAEGALNRAIHLYNKKTAKPVSAPVKVGKWVVTGPLAKGDIADVHLVEHESDPVKAVLKIAQNARDNDLIVAERNSLKTIKAEANGFAKYAPELLDGFRASGKEANVISLHSDYMPLSEIIRLIKPLDFRHVVWMINRSLSILGAAHRCGIVHGAVNPDHLLFGPVADGQVGHGLKLIDWCYSSTGDPIKAAVKKYKTSYPPEVLRKMSPAPGTDLYMLATSITDAIPVIHIPRRFHPLFERLHADSPFSRPRDAWQFQDQWLEAAGEVYGPPKFTPLDLPVH